MSCAAGVKRLALRLRVNDGGEGSNTVTSNEDHRYVLHIGLPCLLAACPLLGVHLHIDGASPFVECNFQLPKVPCRAVVQLHVSNIDMSTSVLVRERGNNGNWHMLLGALPPALQATMPAHAN